MYQISNTDKLSGEMKDVLNSVASDSEIIIERIEIMSKHIHLLINFSPRKSAVDVIKTLKGRNAFIFLKRHSEIRRAKSQVDICGYLVT